MPSQDTGAVAARRASIAVMPFVDTSTVAGARGGPADALAHDVITRLAQFRSLFVIGTEPCSRSTSVRSGRRTRAGR